MQDPLPSFRKPPVVETVLGVQFDPIDKLSNGHLGAFWASLGGLWNEPTDVGPLPQMVEVFDYERTWLPGGLRFDPESVPKARLRIVNPDTDQMIQVQNGWFVYNWRKTPKAPDYPRYSAVRTQFDDRLRDFREFLRRAGLGDVRPSLWEVTYVNHIDRGSLWTDVGGWHRVLPGLFGEPKTPETVRPETTSGTWSFLVGTTLGRLHVRWAHAKRSEEVSQETATDSAEPEVIVLTLTARGPVNPSDTWTGLDTGLNLGRRAIVETFTALSSSAAHVAWERER